MSAYRNEMTLHVNPTNATKSVKILKEYFTLVKTLRRLKNILSITSFFIVLSALYPILYSLYSILSISDSISHDPTFLIVHVYNISCAIAILLSYILSSSKISENLVAIKITASELKVKYIFSSLRDEFVLYILEEIEGVGVLHMDAWGLFEINRNLILTLLGAVLTYDLLIINMTTEFK